MLVAWQAVGHYTVVIRGGALYLKNRFSGAETQVTDETLLASGPLRAQDFAIAKNYSEMQATLARSGNFITLPCITLLPVMHTPLKKLMPPPTMPALQDSTTVLAHQARPQLTDRIGATPPRAVEVFETPPTKRRIVSPQRADAAEEAPEAQASIAPGAGPPLAQSPEQTSSSPSGSGAGSQPCPMIQAAGHDDDAQAEDDEAEANFEVSLEPGC